ncbi:MAG: hypothetical protein O2819_06785 [Planctomycetota bacterium]|nr:hypothetical protein [Planctomycetota bacterium]MDA1106449.1 hypothetical protein [Planctomycetota bacterium]
MPTPSASRTACTLLLGSSLAAALLCATVRAESIDSAITRVPPDVAWALIVPDLGVANKRLEECLARMNRPETAMIGRPIDQLQAFLEIPAGFDETGSLVAWSPTPSSAGGGPGAVESPPVIALVPIQAGVDPIGPLLDIGGATPVDGHDRLVSMTRGDRAYFVSRELVQTPRGSHLVVGSDAALVEGYALPTPPLVFPVPANAASTARLRSHVGAAEVVFYSAAKASGTDALAGASGGPSPEVLGVSMDDSAMQAIKALGELADGMQGAVTCFDIDPMALVVRWMMVAQPESPLAELLAGGVRAAPSLDRLPRATPYMALSVDLQGLGGATILRKLVAALGDTGKLAPDWLLEGADQVTWVQAAAYPSKLGILAGGVLNDSALVVGCQDPTAMLESMRVNVVSMSGVQGAMRREAVWEPDREVKDAGQAAAFTVKEMPMGPSELAELGGTKEEVDDATVPQTVANDAMMIMARRMIFGSKGMTGLATTNDQALVVTFSQRPDVFRRAMEAVGGRGDRLAGDATVKALATMAALDGDVVAMLGIGQLSKVVRQVAGAFGGAGAGGPLDRISTRTDPVYATAEVGGGVIEAAVVIPASVMSLGLEALTVAPSERLMPGGEGEPGSTGTGDQPGPPPDSTDK